MKLTQFGKMRRRIKRELDAARAERALATIQTRALLAAASAQISAVRSTVITAKMLNAWKKEQQGIHLPEDDSAGQEIDQHKKFEVKIL